MKKMMIAIAMFLGAAQAQAFEAPAWACSLSFSGTAHGMKVIYGHYEYNGQGELNCISLTGQKVQYPVNVTMKASALSPQIALGRMELRGQSAEIALFDTNPESILGTYYVAQAQGSVLGGVGVVAATRIDLPQVALKVSLQFAKGLGVNLGVNRMEITLADSQN